MLMKKLTSLAIFASALLLCADEIDIGKPRHSTAGVETIQINGKNAVRITSTAEMPDTLRLNRNFGLKLKPNTPYIISFDMRTENIVPRPTKGMKGAGLYLVSGGKLIYRGSYRGKWTNVTGTTDWNNFQYRFKTGSDAMTYLYFELAEATGTAEFANLSVDEDLPKSTNLDDLAKNGLDFSKNVDSSGQNQIITVDGKKVLKLIVSGQQTKAYRRYLFNVTPGAAYKLSCRFRGNNIVPLAGKSLKGAGLSVTADNKMLYRGSDLGKWKHHLGTFDWQTIELTVKAEKSNILSIAFELADASGSAEFTDLTLLCISQNTPKPIVKKISRPSCDVTGIVFADTNGNGKQDTDEKGFPNVQVSDGLQIVVTDANGNYSINKADGKFIFISKPSNGTPTTPTYLKTAARADFGLKPIVPGSKTVFYSLNDSEYVDASSFIGMVKNASKQLPGDFLVHCGDIGNIPGHKKTMPAAGMPVYYAIGNHDFHKHGSNGEELFEENFGPVYYSFNYNGIHFISIAYLVGVDAPPTPDLGKRQLEWLKKDLALNPGTKIIFRHHPIRFEDEAAKIILNEPNNIIATVSGHTHATSTKIINGINNIECAPPNKGAVDHSVKGIIRGVVENGKVTFSIINEWNFRPSPAADPDAAPVKLAGNWQQFRRDSMRSGDLATALKMPLKLRWKAQTDGLIFASSPIIYDNMIFIATLDDSMGQNAAVYAYNATDGKMLWKSVVGASVKHTLAADSQRVYGSMVDGYAFALDRSSGKMLWKTFIPYHKISDGVYSPVLLHNNRLFVGGDHVAELDIASGKIIREDNKRRRGSPCHAGAIIAENRIYSNENWRYGVYAHDLSTGQQLWTTQRGADGAYTFLDSGPVYANGKLYLKVRDGVRTLAPATGELLKKYSFNRPKPTMESYSLPLATSKQLFCGSAHGMFAHDAETLDLQWSFTPKAEFLSGIPYSRESMPAIYSSPAYAGDTLYFGGGDGFFYALNAADGKELFSFDCGAPIYSSPALSGNTVAVAAANGILYVFTDSSK